jgi:RNA polymerase sigma-70 factor (ECF subfamily)
VYDNLSVTRSCAIDKLGFSGIIQINIMPAMKNRLSKKSVIPLNSSNIDVTDPEIPDQQIVELAITGNMDAFSVLYQRNINKIFSYIYYRTGNTHEAEDLTARVFHRAMMHIRNYVNTGVPFSAWLYRIAHNLVANWHRDNERRREVPLEDNEFKIPGTKYPESTVVEDQDVEMLLKSIRKLSGERQTLIILKYVEDCSNAEIAEIMGRSEGAIKSLYHRTLLALRYELEKSEKGPVAKK